jgi:hypothetical protein
MGVMSIRYPLDVGSSILRPLMKKIILDILRYYHLDMVYVHFLHSLIRSFSVVSLDEG